ncbi:sugar ABC transporter permease [Paenibacillus sp. FSL R5-0744]|uniref:carbohydrate ABC transporter permease n=1 Tax=unclassified Paenibacillus TaxID=185978 RepID=UPI0004F73125|nr:sugar ABC transporter permease [Paenibacillus sp. FSL H7-0737]AIQ24899.1 sugar ABC transporter permease [Paenibacillus sp. FSL H7-0737]
MRISKPIMMLFLLPAILVYMSIFFYPTLRAVFMSFYEISNINSSISEWKFIGLDNYWGLFHNSYFLNSSLNVLKIWIIGGLIVFVMAFFFSVLISSGVRFKGFWRALIYLPNTVSVVVMSVIWLQYVYNPTFGLLTHVFRLLGLEQLANIQWTDDQHLFLSMLIAFCFGSIGYFLLILGAAMDRIPNDYYEAALLEGANTVYQFFHITLPLLRDVFKTTLVLWTVTAINFFVWSSIFGRNDPHTMTPGYYMYLKVFGGERISDTQAFNVGAGAAIGVLITVAIIGFSFLIGLLFRKDRLEY